MSVANAESSKRDLDPAHFYPTSPLNRLYRNNLKVSIGRPPVKFFKKVYQGSNTPSCAISKIKIGGDPSNAFAPLDPSQ